MYNRIRYNGSVDVYTIPGSSNSSSLVTKGRDGREEEGEPAMVIMMGAGG
jgi:hypothetical protein